MRQFSRAPGVRPPWKRSARTRRRPRPRLCTVLLAGIVTTASLVATGCGPAPTATQGCAPQAEVLAASTPRTLIAEIPRSSVTTATWGLRELAKLMPYLATSGLQLHVLYSQDRDDLVPGGGDGGPPQVLFSMAPSFPVVRMSGAPARPADPTHLTTQLYCKVLAKWEAQARQAAQSDSNRRAASVAGWARDMASRLTRLSDRPIPDTAGPEAGGEVDAAASVFAAVQIAQSAVEPTIFFVGGLTEMVPPGRSYRVGGRLVALVVSDDPGQVLPAEARWTRWAHLAAASFEAVSTNAAPAAIAHALAPGGR